MVTLSVQSSFDGLGRVDLVQDTLEREDVLGWAQINPAPSGTSKTGTISSTMNTDVTRYFLSLSLSFIACSISSFGHTPRPTAFLSFLELRCFCEYAGKCMLLGFVVVIYRLISKEALDLAEELLLGEP